MSEPLPDLSTLVDELTERSRQHRVAIGAATTLTEVALRTALFVQCMDGFAQRLLRSSVAAYQRVAELEAENKRLRETAPPAKDDGPVGVCPSPFTAEDASRRARFRWVIAPDQTQET